MYSISEQQIDFILKDLRREGIELEDLQLNLLDHICCIIEQELEENGDFESFYQQLKPRFYKKHLLELEEETYSLLTFKHYYTMKKTMIVSGLAAAFVLSSGIAFKFLYWNGASFLIVTGIFLLSFIFLPLYFILRIKETNESRNKVVLGIGSLICISISLAILFKVMHWPGANMLGLISLGSTLLLFLPVYLLSGIRNPETKINTLVTSVLIVSGAGLFLTLMQSPKGSRLQYKAATAQVLRNEHILQTEQRQVPSLKANMDTNLTLLGDEIHLLCEQIKNHIGKEEIGTSQWLAEIEKSDAYIQDGSVIDYFTEDAPLNKPLTELKAKISTYNIMIKGKQLNAIPLQTALFEGKYETICGALNTLIQIEMYSIQNQKDLLLALKE